MCVRHCLTESPPDTYIHYDDLVALNKAHLEELGFASSNPDMLWQPYPTAAQADAVDKKLAEKEKKRQEKEEQARKAGKAGKPLGICVGLTVSGVRAC